MDVPETVDTSVRNTWEYTSKILDVPGMAGGKQKKTMVTMAKMAAKALTNAEGSASGSLWEYYHSRRNFPMVRTLTGYPAGSRTFVPLNRTREMGMI
jgi:hypothetical protein